MRIKLIRSITSFVAFSIILLAVTSNQLEAASPEAPDMPEWASVMPAKTLITAAVEDAEQLRELLFPSDPSKAEFISLERISETVGAYDPELKTAMDVLAARLKTYLGILQGSFADGASAEPEWPTFTFAANLKPHVKDIGEFLSQELQPVLSRLGVESSLGEEEGVPVLRLGDHSTYYAMSGSRLCCSSDKRTLLRMKEGLSPGATLAGKASFQRARS